MTSFTDDVFVNFESELYWFAEIETVATAWEEIAQEYAIVEKVHYLHSGSLSEGRCTRTTFLFRTKPFEKPRLYIPKMGRVIDLVCIDNMGMFVRGLSLITRFQSSENVVKSLHDVPILYRNLPPIPAPEPINPEVRYAPSVNMVNPLGFEDFMDFLEAQEEALIADGQHPTEEYLPAPPVWEDEGVVSSNLYIDLTGDQN